MWRRKSAAAFPSWVLLDPFILRRDKAASFPDETKAPISFSGTTSCGDAFLLAFHLAEPPRISSLYAHVPAGLRQERDARRLPVECRPTATSPFSASAPWTIMTK